MHRIKLLVFLGTLLSSCGHSPETTKPTLGSISESVYASGIIKSKNQYQVFTVVTGLIDKIYVSEGDSVSKGSPLMLINNEAIRLGTENARLAAEFADENSNNQRINELNLIIESARQKMQNDSVLLQRQINLWNSGIGTRLELEQRQLSFDNSLSAFKASLLRLEDLKKQIRFSSEQSKKNLSISQSHENDFLIRSKIDGKVYAILKEEGELVNVQTPLALLGDAKEFIIELQIDEYDIVKIKNGQRVFVRLDSYKGEIYEAVVIKIHPMLNERTKTFTAEAVFLEAPSLLFPQLTLEASILIEKKDNVLTIPRQFISENQFVYKSNGEKVKVLVGLKDYQRAEILEGLDKDDELMMPAE